MPTKTHHVILRSRIEVTLDEHSKNNIRQHTLDQVVHRHIMPILSKLFSQYVPDDAIIHLDKLVIDVGDLNLSTLDKQLPYQVEQILMVKLKEKIDKVLHNPSINQIIPLPNAKMQAIAHYLSEGNFAWWMVERSEKQIEKTYLELLHHTPLLIAQLWSNLTKKEKAVQRCMTLFSQTIVADTLAYLLKQPIPYFTPILTEVGLLLHQVGILTNRPYTLQQQLHGMALLAIINQQKYKIDRIYFLQILLQQAAIQTSTSYETILEKLHACYEQNEKKSSYNPTIKALVFQLRDMVATPPKYWYQNDHHQQKVLKELDKIGNHTMAPYQLSSAIGTIKTVIDQPGIRSLVKSWLKEKKNREKLIKRLPDELFVGFLKSINPYVTLDFGQIAATTSTIVPISTIKGNALAYCAFEYFNDVKNQEKVLKVLEAISSPTVAQLSSAIGKIKATIDQPGVRSLVKHWLKKKQNRDNLIKRLPDALFIRFLKSIDPYIVTLYADFSQIMTAITTSTPSTYALKANTLAYCAFEHPVYLKAIQLLCRQHISNGLISKQHLSILYATHAYHSKVAAVIEPLVSIAQTSVVSDGSKTTIYSDERIDTNPQLVSTQPTYLNRVAISEGGLSNLLKALERIIHPTIAADERSRAINEIKVAIDQSGVRSLVKSWLKQKENRKKLIKCLPDALFIRFLQSIDPYIATLYDDFSALATATTATIASTCAVKANTLAYCAFEHSKIVYLKAIQSLFRQHISNGLISKQHLSILCATHTYHPAVGEIMRPLVSITQASLLPDGKKIRMDHDNSLHTDGKLSAISYLNRDAISGLESNISDVVDFLLYNELPKDQLVPAYVIAKRLGDATCQQIRDHLTPLCQEATILRKLIQNTTEPILKKLLQAFVPFSDQILDRLEQAITQSKALQCTEQLTNIRFIKEVFIKAAIIHIPPTTEKQYIERILYHLGIQTSCSPTILCDQLIDGAKQITDYHLAETFSLLKKNLALLNLNKIDEVDFMFLFTHETFSLEETLLPLYYSKLIPAIKHRVRASDGADVSQSVVYQLVVQHLPTIDKRLQSTIGTALYKQITDSLQGKQQRVAKRWTLFLHTGQLEQYTDVTALLNDVIEHLPTFSLAQDKIHVRRRLIANFTSSQLISLVRNHNDIGKRLANFIQGSYQLWCATEGLVQQNITRSLFWDSVLKTLPITWMAKDNWLAALTTEWSNVLQITPTTLLETFRIFIQDPKGIPEVEKLATSLYKIEEKYRKGIQQEAIQRGYKTPILTKLYLLLNGSLSFLSQAYPLAMATLGNELMQYMVDQPLDLLKLFKEQDNHELAARRMVYYFSEEITIKMIACLAKEKAPFIMHYLDLLSNALPYTIIPGDHLCRWKKELCISIMHYLITKSQIEEMEFVHRILLTIYYPKETVYQVITSIVANEATNPKKNKIINLLKPLIKQMNQNKIDASTVVNNPLEQLATTLEKKIAKKNSVATEEVRVYTKNTGLVFLWPFFYDFFKVHNLMVRNEFVCEQAAHNAVYLLQYLVTGKLNSPEWQLTLPKLLCGLAYDAVLLPYSPIDASDDGYDQPQAEMVAQLEQQPLQDNTKKIAANSLIAADALEAITIHTEPLIEKVITRWKSLKKLKDTMLYQDVPLQNILNHYFLNRIGILTIQQVDNGSESRSWHLTMMHQDYDTVELLPPWSMTRLKLPWMQEAIVLFWIVE